MKNLLTLILTISVLSINAQNKPKPIKERVKNEVIRLTKSKLELPKYFKLEKIEVFEIQKAGFQSNDVGNEEVLINDTNGTPKYIVFHPSQTRYPEFESNILYKIDTIEKRPLKNGVMIHYYFYDNAKDYNYVKHSIKYGFSDNDGVFFLYNSKKTEKIKVQQLFTIKIIYWAMSNGGELRLYKDFGTATIQNNGKITYEPDEN